MNEFESKLEYILNDPQTMNQIMTLAKSLGSGPPSDSKDSTTNIQTDENNSLTLPESIDPGMLSAVISMLTQNRDGEDARVALLEALRPFVKETRYAKLDRALQIARMSRLIRVGLDIFRTGDLDHV